MITYRIPSGYFNVESSNDVPKDEIWIYYGSEFIKIVNIRPEEEETNE